MTENSETLIVFAGDLWDESLACSFYAFIRYFESDASGNVTTYATEDIGAFVEEGPMLHGDEQSPRGEVWRVIQI